MLKRKSVIRSAFFMVKLPRSYMTDGKTVKVAQLCPTLYDPMDYTVHGIPQTRILEWVAFSFSRGSSQPPGIEPRSPALQADSSPPEPPGKPKNTGVGSLPSPADLPSPGIEPGSLSTEL